jgi:hypothetical protein
MAEAEKGDVEIVGVGEKVHEKRDEKNEVGENEAENKEADKSDLEKVEVEGVGKSYGVRLR